MYRAFQFQGNNSCTRDTGVSGKPR